MSRRGRKARRGRKEEEIKKNNINSKKYTNFSRKIKAKNNKK